MRRVVRVGIFSECYHPIENGVVASIDALCDGLRAAGHEAVIVAPAARAHALAPEVRVPSLPLPTRTAYRLAVPVLGARANANLRSLSVIHTHSPFVTGWMGVHYARRFGLPLVFTYHTQLEEYAHYVPFERSATRRAASTLTRTYANLAYAVIVPTQAMAERLRALGVSAPLSVIPTGIDVERFAAGRRSSELRERLVRAPRTRLILLVSRLAREKNVELAFAALAALDDPGAHLVLAGDGPQRPALEAAARAAGLGSRVHFLGHVERGRLPELYASCDAFVFPSTTETQGVVLAEAVVAGLPVVAAETPQTREVLGGSGILASPTAEAFAEALKRALAGGRPQNAARLALERFSIEVQTRRILDVYGWLLERRESA
ncbi:MAG: glycosyltransferase [Candidatus Eremiobacteraeota bacterium]|nr:glycosyltransferase [Candidatus Eremiobacteraeota bacterium]